VVTDFPPTPDASAGDDAVDLVVVGASAGGVPALQQLVAGLPADLAVPVAIVLHVDPRHRSLLTEILRRRATLPVETAEDGAPLAPATIYIAPPGAHLLVNHDRTMSLTHSELVHFVRPSVDLLFESAAAAFGPGTIAAILTGTGTDGAMGAAAVKQRGGTVIVQDAATSDYFGMPAAAIATGCVDRVLSLAEIPVAIAALVAASQEVP
jgi:two-component system, chemotaxis family, protein-glutamate methylesterase/glutaminase